MSTLVPGNAPSASKLLPPPKVAGLPPNVVSPSGASTVLGDAYSPHQSAGGDSPLDHPGSRQATPREPLAGDARIAATSTMFDAIDTNQDGVITREELHNAMGGGVQVQAAFPAEEQLACAVAEDAQRRQDLASLSEAERLVQRLPETTELMERAAQAGVNVSRWLGDFAAKVECSSETMSRQDASRSPRSLRSATGASPRAAPSPRMDPRVPPVPTPPSRASPPLSAGVSPRLATGASPRSAATATTDQLEALGGVWQAVAEETSQWSAAVEQLGGQLISVENSLTQEAQQRLDLEDMINRALVTMHDKVRRMEAQVGSEATDANDNRRLIESLRNEIVAQSHNGSDQLAKLDDLNKKISQLQTDAEWHARQAVERTSTLVDTAAAAESLQEQLVMLSGAVKKMEADGYTRDREVESAIEKANSMLRSATNVQRSEQHEMQSQMGQLAAVVSDLQANASDRDDLASQLRVELGMEAGLRAMQEQATGERLAGLQAALESEAVRSAETARVLDQEVSSQAAQIHNMQRSAQLQQLADVEKQQQNQAALGAVRGELAAVQARSLESQTTLGQITTALTDMQAAIEGSGGQLDAVREAQVRFQDHLARLSDAVHDQEARDMATRAAQDRALSAQAYKVDDLSGRMSAEVAKWEKNSDALEGCVSDMRARALSEAERREKAEQSLSDTIAQVKWSVGAIQDRVQQELAIGAQQQKDQEAAMSALRADLAGVGASTERQQAELNDVNRALRLVERAAKDGSTRMEEMEEAQRKEQAQLQQQVSQLTGTIQSLRMEALQCAADREAEARRGSDAAMQTIAAESAKMQGKVDDVETQVRDMQQDVQGRLSRSQTDQLSLAQDMSSFKGQVEEVKRQQDEDRRAEETCRGQQAEMMAALSSEMKALGSSLGQSSIDALSKASAAINDLDALSKRHEEAVERGHNQLTAAAAAHDRDCADLRQQIGELSKAVADLQEEAQSGAARGAESDKAAAARVSELVGAVQSEHAAWQGQMRRVEGQMAEIEGKLQDLRNDSQSQYLLGSEAEVRMSEQLARVQGYLDEVQRHMASEQAPAPPTAARSARRRP